MGINHFDIEKVKRLITSTMNAELSLEDFYNQWDELWNVDIFLKEIHDDLESSIEHVPGIFFSNRIDIKKWQDSPEYTILRIDLDLLNAYHELSSLQIQKRKYDMTRNALF